MRRGIELKENTNKKYPVKKTMQNDLELDCRKPEQIIFSNLIKKIFNKLLAIFRECVIGKYKVLLNYLSIQLSPHVKNLLSIATRFPSPSRKYRSWLE